MGLSGAHQWVWFWVPSQRAGSFWSVLSDDPIFWVAPSCVGGPPQGNFKKAGIPPCYPEAPSQQRVPFRPEAHPQVIFFLSSLLSGGVFCIGGAIKLVKNRSRTERPAQVYSFTLFPPISTFFSKVSMLLLLFDLAEPFPATGMFPHCSAPWEAFQQNHARYVLLSCRPCLPPPTQPPALLAPDAVGRDLRGHAGRLGGPQRHGDVGLDVQHVVHRASPFLPRTGRGGRTALVLGVGVHRSGGDRSPPGQPGLFIEK